MRGLLLLALLTSGCALRAPLVTPGQAIQVTWNVAPEHRMVAFYVVRRDLGDGWIEANFFGEDELRRVNLNLAIEIAQMPTMPHPAISLDDGVRERVSR